MSRLVILSKLYRWWGR